MRIYTWEAATRFEISDECSKSVSPDAEARARQKLIHLPG